MPKLVKYPDGHEILFTNKTKIKSEYKVLTDGIQVDLFLVNGDHHRLVLTDSDQKGKDIIYQLAAYGASRSLRDATAKDRDVEECSASVQRKIKNFEAGKVRMEVSNAPRHSGLNIYAEALVRVSDKYTYEGAKKKLLQSNPEEVAELKAYLQPEVQLIKAERAKERAEKLKREQKEAPAIL